MLGGTASELSGGKFANGAITASFTHLFNAEMENIARSFGAPASYQFAQIMSLEAKNRNVTAANNGIEAINHDIDGINTAAENEYVRKSVAAGKALNKVYSGGAKMVKGGTIAGAGVASAPIPVAGEIAGPLAVIYGWTLIVSGFYDFYQGMFNLTDALGAKSSPAFMDHIDRLKYVEPVH